MKVLNKGGMIILDDSDRINTSQEYVKAVDILKQADLLQVDFYGFCPMNNYTKNTDSFHSVLSFAVLMEVISPFGISIS